MTDHEVIAPTVVLIGTGGTIAARVDSTGVATVASDLPNQAGIEYPVPVRTRHLLASDSAALTAAQLDAIDAEIRYTVTDPNVIGVVVSHGTDTMEETAMLVALHHSARTPVVFTGAQRTADHPDPDGPANLRAAVAAAADPARRDRVWIAFAGRVLPAAGTTKLDTADLEAFGPVPLAAGLPVPIRPLLTPAPIAGVTVDIIALHVGADGRMIRAAIAGGADGVVVAALGGGNAHPSVVEAVTEATERGIPVALTSRTPFGPIITTYGGGGGGHDLAAAGAMPTGFLRASQARIALAATIATARQTGTISEIRETFTGLCRAAGPTTISR